MKCPACELEIDIERLQVQHIERCHPDLLVKRWAEAKMPKEDMLAQMVSIQDQYPPLEAIVDECLQATVETDIQIVKGSGFYVNMVANDGRTVESKGSTLMSAICLAMDRLEFGK